MTRYEFTESREGREQYVMGMVLADDREAVKVLGSLQAGRAHGMKAWDGERLVAQGFVQRDVSLDSVTPAKGGRR
jgi:hypothetical protein